MVTNYAKRRVKFRIERAKFQFVSIFFAIEQCYCSNFVIKEQWILKKAITVKANFTDYPNEEDKENNAEENSI